ncbi:MAG: hypothetical protein ACLTDX_15290 [[Clostridium] innocuum]
MLDVVRSVFNTFGATVFVPIMLFIVAKMMGSKHRKHLTAVFLRQLD